MENQTKTAITPRSALSGDIFDQIRGGFRFVAQEAQHVRIREDRLSAYALSLQPRPPANTLDETHHYVTDHPEDLASYILSLDAINFGSGYKEDLVEEGWVLLDGSIYYTVSTALKKHFDNQGPWTPRTLCQVTPQDMQGIFNFPDAIFGREVAMLFATSLNEFGAYVEREYASSFMTFIDSAKGQMSDFVTALAVLPSFSDIYSYHGRNIPIYKRAQIAAADLELSFRKINRPLFADISKLTMFADDAVPHVLHVDGVLEYDDTLTARIAAGAIIPSGSAEEIEIRCCAGEVVERLAGLKSMAAMDIDHVLWHRSVEDGRYQTTLPHRTRTRFY